MGSCRRGGGKWGGCDEVGGDWGEGVGDSSDTMKLPTDRMAVFFTIIFPFECGKTRVMAITSKMHPN